MSNNSVRSRATNEQLNSMADFMLNNTGLGSGKFRKLHGKLECDKKWTELAISLNSLGGAVKTIDQWHTVWKDLKSRTNVKIRERKKQQALTGNNPISQDPITELERRIVAIIGSDYIEGHKSVPENVTVKEEHQFLLDEGADYMFDLPTSPSIEEFQCVTPSPCITPTAPKRTPRCCAKRRHVEEEDDAKKQFLEIASKQADALKLLAESSAENAKALKMLGECAAANLEVGKVMAESVKGLAESMSATAKAVHTIANAINKLC